jgi:hypothetical protein
MTQVGINADGAATDGSAMLDVNSANRGVLLPRMNYSQLMGIVNPAEGLIVFCTDFRCGASGNKTTG